VRQLTTEVREALVAREPSDIAKPQRDQTTTEIALHVEQCFEGLELDQDDEAERRWRRLFMHLSRDQQMAVVQAVTRVASTT
jgi:hypothetical protein